MSWAHVSVWGRGLGSERLDRWPRLGSPQAPGHQRPRRHEGPQDRHQEEPGVAALVEGEWPAAGSGCQLQHGDGAQLGARGSVRVAHTISQDRRFMVPIVADVTILGACTSRFASVTASSDAGDGA